MPAGICIAGAGAPRTVRHVLRHEDQTGGYSAMTRGRLTEETVDRTDNSALYRVPVTQVEDVAASFSPGELFHFCPGTVGGAEWNSPAYDPRTNLVLVGEVDWCDSVRPQDVNELKSVPL